MAEGITAVLIVTVVFSFISFKVYMKYQTEKLKHGVEANKIALATENERLSGKVASLENRVEVLESIVTGKEFKLNEEIDALR